MLQCKHSLLWFGFDLFQGERSTEIFSLLLKQHILTFSAELGSQIFFRFTSFEESEWGFPPPVWEFPKAIPHPSVISWRCTHQAGSQDSVFFWKDSAPNLSSHRNKHLYWSVSKAHSYDIKSAPCSLLAWQSAAFAAPQWNKERGYGTGMSSEQHHVTQPSGGGTGESIGVQCARFPAG